MTKLDILGITDQEESTKVNAFTPPQRTWTPRPRDGTNPTYNGPNVSNEIQSLKDDLRREMRREFDKIKDLVPTRTNREQRSTDGRPICFRWRKIGHTAKVCRVNNFQQQKYHQNTQNPNTTRPQQSYNQNTQNPNIPRQFNHTTYPVHAGKPQGQYVQRRRKQDPYLKLDVRAWMGKWHQRRHASRHGCGHFYYPQKNI